MRFLADRSLIQTALGQRRPDLVVGHGRLVNVYTGEILDGQHVAISGRRIAYVGPDAPPAGPDTEVIDAQGAYLLPGYVDPHAHVDFWANPIALAHHFLATGTTALMADPHDVTGALGPAGLELIIGLTRGLPLKCWFSLPAVSPPFPALEGDDVLPIEQMEPFLARPEILALGEITPWVRLAEGDEQLLAKLALARRYGKRVEGHTTGAANRKLNALVAAGLTSCHESITDDEARARLRLGLPVMLRHGSIRADLSDLIRVADGLDTSRIMLTPDWMSPPDVLSRGYMDGLVRLAIERGVPPVTAVQMATRNPAVYLGLDHEVGGIAPGRRADVLVVDDLRRPAPRLVIADGRVVARGGQLTIALPPVPDSALTVPWPAHRRLPASLDAGSFAVPASGDAATVPAIAIVDKTITRRQDVTLPVRDGHIALDPGQDVLKLAQINRDNSGFAVGFLAGFGARVGGLASSIAHELHKPVALGSDEADMAAALRRMEAIGGGVVLVHGGQVRAEIRLPIGGVMSARSVAELAGEMAAMTCILREMGCGLSDPLFTVGFLTFSALPWVRMTPSGVMDVRTRRVIWPAT